jgi:single-stranded-DNA-specific exonuclease
LAHYGLKVLRKSRRPGLQQLLRKARADQRFLTEDDIGFTIGPRINAASRMDSPESAFNLLSVTDVTEAGKEVEHLEKLNNERKGQVASMTKELHGRIKKTEELSPILVFGSPDWRPSLVGLAANKLAEEHNRPAFLWGRDGNNVYKGSCRSGGGISVVKIMEAAPDIFIEYGGHHFSGGFSVVDDKIFNLAEALNDAFQRLGTEAQVKELWQVDAELSLEDVNDELLKHLDALSPFGQDNHKPLFVFKDVTPQSVDKFGKGREHLKLTFPTGSGHLEAIAFFANQNSFTKAPVEGESLTLLAHVEQSRFNGSVQTRLRIVDVV